MTRRIRVLSRALALAFLTWAGSIGVCRAANVRSIELPHFEPELPVALGRNEYMAVCVSCHSPRYVLMQPPFSQRQWEQTVDKMAKNYGAQMDAAQRTAIIGYLVAIHGPGWTGEEAANSDDDFSAPVQLPASDEPAPMLKLSDNASERDAQIRQGESLFNQNCTGCHGSTGRGDGVVAPGLLRKPKNLAANRFSRTLLAQVLWNGKIGTAMPSWRNVPLGDLAALGAYVQTFHKQLTEPSPSAETLQRGATVFAVNCVPCHGATGEGNGIAAANLLPQPANFRLKQPDPDYILEVLRDGIPGTGMPAWQEQIPESDRRALAAFVRSLFLPQDAAF
jgi:cytochrome c oxidase cbb3-type subunit 2/cytochrome c oxidase cbb3-type subunit I/II